jgi:hypothetical protein
MIREMMIRSVETINKERLSRRKGSNSSSDKMEQMNSSRG